MKIPPRVQGLFAVFTLPLLGVGCSPSTQPPLPPPAVQQVQTDEGMPSSEKIDAMTEEERLKAMEKFMDENEPATADAMKLEEAKTLADKMKDATAGKSGSFHRVVHDASGSVQLVKGVDGWAVVFSDDFKTDAGPDLRVYVSGHADPRKSPEVHTEPSRDVGKLTSVNGKQAYQLGDIDVAAVKSIVIYCQPFKVVFAVATLQ